MSTGWDNATLKKLKALVGKGLSTSEIGKRLGMSKNAVVGKLNRLGWNPKAGGLASATTTKKSGTTKKATITPVKTTAKKTALTNTIEKTPVAAKTQTKKSGVTKEKKANTATSTTKKPTNTDKKTLTKNLAMHQRIIQHSLEMANLKPNQCRWPIGDPDSEHFHFCGKTVFVGKPYCYEHCKQAYQFAPQKKK